MLAAGSGPSTRSRICAERAGGGLAHRRGEGGSASASVRGWGGMRPAGRRVRVAACPERGHVAQHEDAHEGRRQVVHRGRRRVALLAQQQVHDAHAAGERQRRLLHAGQLARRREVHAQRPEHAELPRGIDAILPRHEVVLVLRDDGHPGKRGEEAVRAAEDPHRDHRAEQAAREDPPRQLWAAAVGLSFDERIVAGRDHPCNAGAHHSHRWQQRRVQDPWHLANGRDARRNHPQVSAEQRALGQLLDASGPRCRLRPAMPQGDLRVQQACAATGSQQ